MNEAWTLAGVQFDCRQGDVQGNLAYMLRQTRQAAEQGARLIVFPEAALTGYCFASKEAAWPYAETVPGPSSLAVAELCRELNCFVIFGLLERRRADLFNAAVLVGPAGVVGSYRKTHLPFLGVDRFVTPGNRPYEIFEIDGLRLGMLICYDGSFPEAPRILALLGADLIVLPTNWPEGGRCSASHIPPMRAHENHVYFLAVNRVGEEGGFHFIGMSRLVDWHGETLAAAKGEAEGPFFGSIQPELARHKRVVNIPGEYELDRIAGRRPDLYGPLLSKGPS